MQIRISENAGEADLARARMQAQQAVVMAEAELERSRRQAEQTVVTAEAESRQDLMDARDAIQERFAPRAIDFWSGLANPDGSMKSSYNSGDGTHFNDAGHAVLVQLVISCAIPEVIASSGQ